MAVHRIHIDEFLELAKTNPVFDVRSPGEYNHAHMPGALSLPLFTDEERKQVGTAYKQVSREKAIKIGLDYFGPKMRKMVEEVEALATDSRLILVYCWRGGMRSGAVSWLLDMYGFNVYTLIGGYKKFRNHVLDSFKLPYQLNIIGGYTGSGKTELLKTLKEKGELVIDLENIARVIKAPPSGLLDCLSSQRRRCLKILLSCEMSDVRCEQAKNEVTGEELTSDISHHTSRIWLEDESQRIGLVNIPGDLWRNMRRSPVYFLDIPFEERLKHIIPEYGVLDPEKLIAAIERISQKLGHLNAKTAILLLKEGKISESFAILLKYYDKFYFRSLHNREQAEALIHTVKCNTVSPENANLLIRETSLLQQKPLA